MRINYYIILKVLVINGSRLEKKKLRGEILKRFEIDISDGVLYPLIDALVHEGIIREEEAPDGKVLFLTEKGMKEFEDLHEFFKKIVC
ncbi:MAG: PadR family transcriptional regulator [Candidatus Nanopusillus sp.]|jgi:DNA-binding PadR family transcriptional regulator|nr:PadR family transcriptional regulator [Candidatus Nanopusillus sp.]